jgi:hypothetical protein
MTTIAQRVAEGAAFLDVRDPEWIGKVDLERLDLGSCTRCILGQLAGDYEDGVEMFALDGADTVALGFNTTLGFDDLTAEWKRVITERRSAS